MVAAYKYTSDAGITYQAVMSDEFAIPLGYVLAAGNEPYVPDWIAPRFISLQHSTLQLYATAFITTPATIASLPQTITNSEGTWRVLGFVGEKRFASPLSGIALAAGLQGPPGANGQDAVIVSSEITMAADVALTSANTPSVLCASSALAAGTYLLLGTVQFQTGATAGILTAQLQLSGLGGLAQSAQYGLTINQWYQVSVNRLVTLAAGSIVQLTGMSTVTNSSVRKLANGVLATPATRLIVMKV